jgi:hypothetical protein
VLPQVGQDLAVVPRITAAAFLAGIVQLLCEKLGDATRRIDDLESKNERK